LLTFFSDVSESRTTSCIVSKPSGETLPSLESRSLAASAISSACASLKLGYSSLTLRTVAAVSVWINRAALATARTNPLASAGLASAQRWRPITTRDAYRVGRQSVTILNLPERR
jgi:hypothetical protein